MTAAASTFPLGANPAAHMARVPFATALGLVWEGGGGSRQARIRLPFAGPSAASDGIGIDEMSLLPLIDHACSAAVYLALPVSALIATIDLRCEILARPTPGRDAVCIAEALHLDHRVAVVRASVSDGPDGDVVALGSSTYAIGAHPGMAGQPIDAVSRDATCDRRDVSSFRELLGVSTQDENITMPFRPQLVGAVSLPAVHGGATTAALAAAASSHARRMVTPRREWSPISTTVHFLRPVRAADLTIAPVLRKPGLAHCVVGVSAFQSDAEKACVHAECLLIARGPE